jgi:hypothetical protein
VDGWPLAVVLEQFLLYPQVFLCDNVASPYDVKCIKESRIYQLHMACLHSRRGMQLKVTQLKLKTMSNKALKEI